MKVLLIKLANKLSLFFSSIVSQEFLICRDAISDNNLELATKELDRLENLFGCDFLECSKLRILLAKTALNNGYTWREQ